MKNYIKNLIHTIQTASPAEVKIAQKQVEKFWHEFYIPHRAEGRAAFGAFLEELDTFIQIKDVAHQCYFLHTLKWPLMSTGEENFEAWADFLLPNIDHPAGHIRQATIHAIEYLVTDLRMDLKFDRTRVDNENLEKAEYIKIVQKNRARFGNFVMEIEALIDHYYQPKFKKHKYVSSLPPGPYKSLQMLITEILLRSDYYEKLYQDFLNELRERRHRPTTPPDIITKREQIEKQLAAELRNLKSDFNVEDIKKIIFNEHGRDDLGRLMRLFDRGQDIDEMNRLLQIAMDEWNHFPHQRLDGASPTEKYQELYSPSDPNQCTMPRLIGEV